MKIYHGIFLEKYPSIRILFFCVLIALTSCKNDDLIGLEVQPENEKIQVFTFDTCTVNAFSVKEDTIRTDQVLQSLCGSINDEIFGIKRASFATQFRLAFDNHTFGNASELIADSVVLSLSASYFTGQNIPMNFRVYELTQALEATKAYYSNEKFLYNTTPIGELLNYTPNLLDSVTLNEGREAPQMRIKLDASLAEKLIKSGTSPYLNNTNFLAFFKGLYIEGEAVNMGPGEGRIMVFNLLSSASRMKVYYRNTNLNQSGTFEYVINETSKRVNAFSNDYNNAIINTYFNSPEKGKERIFVQSNAGVKVKIETPFLKNIADHDVMLINKAEIGFKLVEGTANSTFPAHERLFLVAIDNNGTSVFTPDQLEGDAHYGGIANTAFGGYTFNLTRYFQNILLGNIKNNGLYLVGSGSAINAYRTVLHGTDAGDNSIKLKITYTKINDK
jgi:hypothetical protein